MQSIRNSQYNQLENNLKTVESLIRLTDPQALTIYRDGGTGFTALEVLCHLRDIEAIFIERATVTLEQEDGALPFPDPDALARDQRYNDQNVEDVLAQWQANRARYLAMMRECSESDWERTAIHPKRGKMTLWEQLALITLHDTVHMEQMTRTLYEKKVAG